APVWEPFSYRLVQQEKPSSTSAQGERSDRARSGIAEPQQRLQSSQSFVSPADNIKKTPTEVGAV
ncbi:MAG: hypothetical protein IIT53_00210, partial [Fibrobacter sp.]|nr:hypothetical protein [Fibrobacter sp.]